MPPQQTAFVSALTIGRIQIYLESAWGSPLIKQWKDILSDILAANRLVDDVYCGYVVVYRKIS